MWHELQGRSSIAVVARATRGSTYIQDAYIDLHLPSIYIIHSQCTCMRILLPLCVRELRGLTTPPILFRLIAPPTYYQDDVTYNYYRDWSACSTFSRGDDSSARGPPSLLLIFAPTHPPRANYLIAGTTLARIACMFLCQLVSLLFRPIGRECCAL